MDPMPLFPEFPAHELQELLGNAVTRAYRKGAVILNEGDPADSVCFVLRGRVRVFLSDARGREIIIGQLGPGDYFGEMCLEPGTRSASVVTLEASQFAMVRAAEFRDFLKTHPDFMLALMGKMVRRARALARNVKSLALLDVYSRLCQFLHEMATPKGAIWVIDECPIQQEIAGRIGSSREMISRIFKELVAGGYLSVSRQRIEILRRLPRAW